MTRGQLSKLCGLHDIVANLAAQPKQLYHLDVGRAARSSQALKLPKGSIVAVDRAYLGFAWISHLILQGVFLVTHMKKEVRHRVLERRLIKAASRGRPAIMLALAVFAIVTRQP